MRKLSVLTIAFLSFTNFVTSQINGKVTDEQNQPIEFVNIALFNLPDSALITGTVTNANGEFTLEKAETKNAFLQISFIGYETRTVPATSGQTTVLKNESTQLGEVVVQGNLPRIEIKNDALVTTVQNTVLSKAGTGNDVLKRLPSLTGDNGVFSVFGKGQAKIYINNREMRDVSELENLNSADIRNVEIVNNPGARYDATIKAVIRINTVRKAGDGFGFDIRSSYYQSQNTDLYEQLNVNYRKNGLDVFGTFTYYHREWFQDSKIWQNTYVDTLWQQNNTLYVNGYNNDYTGITGINYEITPKHYIGAKYTFSKSPENKWYTKMNSKVLANSEYFDEWGINEDKSIKNKPAHRLNAYYNGAFDKLNVDFNADYYTNEQWTFATATETSQEFEDRIITSDNDVNNRLFASKLTLTYPVLGGQFSVGNEYTNTRRNDTYQNMEHIVASSATSIREQNAGFFAEYTRKTPIGQMSAGIRYENVNSEYFKDGKKVDDQSRKYGQWFPNVSLSSKIKNVSLQLSYTAKTRRPNYRQLSGNVLYLNRFLLQSGNPYLKPSITHDMTAVSSWRFVQAVVSYQKRNNTIIDWTEQMPENPAISILKFKNIDEMSTLNVYVSLSPTFGAWQPQLSGGIAKQWLTITAQDNPVHFNGFIPFVTFNNSFRLPKGFLFTLDTRFQGKGDYQNMRLMKNQYIIHAGISKSFLEDQLNISLKMYDIFYDQTTYHLFKSAQSELFQRNRMDSRQLELTVRYKFNPARSKYKGTSVGQSEINRF